MSEKKTTLTTAPADAPTTIAIGGDLSGLPCLLVDAEPPLDMLNVVCLDCGWQGKGYQLAAQACPVCDGRCADV